ncbi:MULTISPECIES: ATP-dependent DNA helicase [unclassified Actinopolyspora]|uniref:PD-(D/E)XK nuclease family protein n=1 Tax=unclassified Actinopolyspora TaxID=2639451 RepID=UPI0013F64977|nr:ATP-dependent helicase [Actinopolyspora sp. BKK2]NHE77850.1 ATP-dependent helicase [Actinopolyspora sp. BKK1]
MSTFSVPTLVRSGEQSAPRLRWSEAQRRVIDGANGFLRILGGPGTGKTTLLAEAVAERLLDGRATADDTLVLTANRTTAALMRSAVNSRLLADESSVTTGRAPLVRTVHSYAFGVLRLRASRDGAPQPRLLNGPEQDLRIRQLLEGDLEDGAEYWPESLRAALRTEGFVTELRDLLMRAAERGVGPNELVALGRRHERPEWVAAGIFGRQYERVTQLGGASGDTAPPLDAAELVSAALAAFDSDAELLAAERTRVRHLVVDDAQNLDPQQYRLCRRIGDTASEFLLGGDPDQAVFSFRGADPSSLSEADPSGERTLVLGADHRMSTRVRRAVRRLAARLPGSGEQRRIFGADLAEDSGQRDEGGEQSADGGVQVRLLASQAQQAAWVADQLRRAHLLRGVAWSDMAVIVKSTGISLPVLRRALLAAGVPLELGDEEIPLGRRPAVRPLLTLLRCAARPSDLDSDTAEYLLGSLLGGADSLALRRLRRGLRRLDLEAGNDRPSGEVLVEALWDADRLAALQGSTAEPARRVSALLDAAGRACARGQSVEDVLWRIWKDSGVEQTLLARSERGGVGGARADRDLDAVVALFDEAARYVDRLPGADAASFVEHLENQRISGDTLAPSAPGGDAVSVLTAHAAVGREWEVVAVPDVQEGIWPDLRLRGSLLGVERLVDVLSGVDSPDVVSASAPLLAEERRLLLVAASRARRTLLVGAVRGEEEQPSRFLDELDGTDEDPETEQRQVARPERGLSLPELVGELRQVVNDDTAGTERRRHAAAQLARLADAGVRGAHPDSWYGLPEPSSSAPLVGEDEPVRVSPSTVEVLSTCPLRWMIERHGGQDAAELASVAGTVVHSLVQAAAEGADRQRLEQALDQTWESVDAGAPWYSRRERERVRGMLDSFLAWLDSSRAELEQVAVERDLDLTVPAREGEHQLRLRGRVDRLEEDGGGRPVIVDIKTSKTPVSKERAGQHTQLAVYQLAAALGAFGAEETREPGGARLVYVAKPESRSGAATERVQRGFDEEEVRGWLDVVHEAAAAGTGPEFRAVENAECPRCPVRTSCPVHSSGRQVGQ